MRRPKPGNRLSIAAGLISPEEPRMPPPALDLARRRTAELLRRSQYGFVSFRDLLAACYLLGVEDAVEALDSAEGFR